MAQTGLQEHELLDAVDAPQLRDEGPLEHCLCRVAVHLDTSLRLVRTVGASLDQAQLTNIARQCRLCNVEARRPDHQPQLLLALDRLVTNNVENGGLTSRFHECLSDVTSE